MTDRRLFLKQLAAAGAGAGMGAITDLQNIAAAATPAAKVGADYKALVCLFMFGGNDSNNMVIPITGTDATLYDSQRGNVRLNRANLLPVNLTNMGGRGFALHTAMPGMQKLVNDGRCAIMGNVGPLLAPTSRDDYRNRKVPLPMNLFSHSDQQSQWQSSVSDEAPRSGWGGRMADIMKSLNGTNTTSTCISVNGNNLFEQGTTISSYKVSSTAGFGIGMYKGSAATDPVSVAFREAMGRPYANVFEQTWAQIVARAVDQQAVLQQVLASSTTTTVFPNTGLGDQLKMIARLIRVRDALQLTRQVFFCSIGGFDTHGADQQQRQNELLGEISGAVKAFYDATVELGVADKVTLFTASDFARTYASNGGGTDHAWGAAHFVVGGSVVGGQMYSQYPNILMNGPDDSGDGRWIPSMSIDQYASTMARWFGVAEGDLATIFPKLSRFNPNIGFLG